MMARDWNPIIDFEKCKVTSTFYERERQSLLILVIFPNDSIPSLIKYAHDNNLKRCILGKKHLYQRSRVLSSALWYLKNFKNLTIEEKVKLNTLKRDYIHLFKLAEDLRITVDTLVNIQNIEVKVIFEATWNQRRSKLLMVHKMLGNIYRMKQLLYDCFHIQRIPVHMDNIHIVETQNAIEKWYLNSQEGNIFYTMLNRWGYFFDDDEYKSRGSSSQ